MKTIDNREDIRLLVESFYDLATKDKLIGHHFIEVDFDHHLPRMIDFWCLLVLDQPGYSENVIQKHTHMKLSKADFNRWEELFLKTLTDNFTGEKVDLVKQKLAVLKWTMESKVLNVDK